MSSKITTLYEDLSIYIDLSATSNIHKDLEYQDKKI
jgi:hypothetical protein